MIAWVVLAAVLLVVGAAIWSWAIFAPTLDAALGGWVLVSSRRSPPPRRRQPVLEHTWPAGVFVPTYLGAHGQQLPPGPPSPLSARDAAFVCRTMRLHAELRDVEGRLRATVNPEGDLLQVPE